MRNRLEEEKKASQDALGSTPEWDLDLDHYQIVRYYRDNTKRSKIVKTGLTLGEARAHCSSPDSREHGEWFDGYEIEE